MQAMLSIVIPVYNRPLELKRALESLDAQTSKKFEVVVCDDGSEMDIESAVRQFDDRLDIRYVRIENSGGPARPRNTAIAAARYEWISFLDSDDWWMPNRVEEVVKAIEANPGYGVFYHLLKTAGTQRKSYSWSSGVIGSKIGKQHFEHLMTHGDCLPNSSVVVHRDEINKVGGLDENPMILEDFDAWLKLARSGTRFYFVPQILGWYWCGSDGISMNSLKQAKMHEILFAKYIKELAPHYRRDAEVYWSYMIGHYYLLGGQKAKMWRFIRRIRHITHVRLYLKAIVKVLYLH